MPKDDYTPNIEITTGIGCKNACLYCPQEKFIKAYSQRSNIFKMSIDVFKKCLDKIPRNIDICFSGMAEAWLNPDCTKMLLLAHQKGHKIIVYTTLVGMNLEDVALLESVPFKRFRIHLPSKEGYEKIKVDENYLKVLARISRSPIKSEYHCQGQAVPPKVKLLLEGKKIEYFGILGTSTRAGNIKIKSKQMPQKKRGIIACRANLLHNALLPNGDVLLCCIDYGMQHILGNLLSADYHSLFQSQEFLKIKRSLKDDSLDTLCRYCEFAEDANLKAKLFNSQIPYKLKNIRSLKDFFRLTKEGILKLFQRPG